MFDTHIQKLPGAFTALKQQLGHKHFRNTHTHSMYVWLIQADSTDSYVPSVMAQKKPRWWRPWRAELMSGSRNKIAYDRYVHCEL